MSYQDDHNREIDIDLARVFGSVWRHKGKIILTALVATAIAFVVLQTIEPRYRSEARILIRPTAEVLSTSAQTPQAQATDVDEQGVASQVLLLRSRSLAQQVVEELDLQRKAEFKGSASVGLLGSLAGALGLADSQKPVPLDERVLEAFFDRLTVYQADGARVIIVQFWSGDAETAAAVPNALADAYIALQNRLKRGVEGDDLSKLEPELQSLRVSVVKAEDAVADFRAKSNLLQGANNATLASQELSELATQLGSVRADLSEARANASSIRSALESGALDTAASVIASPLVQRLRERLIGLNGQLSDLSTTLLDNHPRIRSLRRQIGDLRREIATEARKIERSLQEQVKVAETREADLLSRREELKAEANRVDKAQVELRALEREADAQRQLLNQYLVRFKEARARQNRGFLPADAFIFSRADVQNRPYFPRRMPTLIGVFFGSLILGAVFAIAASVLSGAAIRETPAASPQPRPLLSSSPQPPQQPQAVAPKPKREKAKPAVTIGSLLRRKKSEPPAVETPAMTSPPVDTTILEAEAPPLMPAQADLRDAGPSTPIPPLEEISTTIPVAARSLVQLGKARIVVLTPEAGAGSHGAVALARAIAHNRKSAILVDLTGRGTATRLMLENHQVNGIKDVMAGTSGFADAMHRDIRSNAHIMPTGRASVRQAAANKMRLGAIVEVLQQAYDYVLLDCGPSDEAGVKRMATLDGFNIVVDSGGALEPLEQACALFADQGFGVPLVVQHEPDRQVEAIRA
ncbi:MAG: Wzz/FepE/Etk N-terminal domain-containing protein [Pseudomonadota bacterium]